MSIFKILTTVAQIAAVVGAIEMVSGCYPSAELWNKDGVTQLDREMDHASCTAMADSGIIWPLETLDRCMAWKGYTK